MFGYIALALVILSGAVGVGYFIKRKLDERSQRRYGSDKARLAAAEAGERAQEAESEEFLLRRGRLVDRARRHRK